jgi:5-methylcytosine-specific restriction endonuclease McrA
MIVKLCLHCGRHYQPPGIRGRCKDCGRAYDQRHSIERRTRNSAKWQQARAAARRRDGERCTNCGSSERLQVHHIVPLAEGGEKFALSNLTTLCSDCHAQVGRGRGTNAGRVSSHPQAVTRERNAHAKKTKSEIENGDS